MSENYIPSLTTRVTTVRHVARLAIIYSIGEIFLKGVNYLLLPLYLRYLPPQEYGIIAIMEVLRTFLGLLLSFGMTGAILRFIHVVDEKEQRSFFGSMWLFLILTAGSVTLLLLIFGSSLLSQLIPNVPFDPYIQKTIIAAFLSSSFAIFPATLFRARDQANYHVAFGAFSALAIAAATILHVVILRQEAAGWVQAQLEGAIAIAMVSMLILLKEAKPSFSWRQLRPALVYGLPLLPHFISHWVLSVSDRMILERYIGLTQLGLYTLAYQFGQGYHILITGIHNAFIPLFGRASKEKAERIILPDMITYYLLAAILFALIVALIGGEVIFLIYPSNYKGAIPLVTWIVLGYFFFAVYNIPMSFLVMTAGETKTIPIATFSAAVVNLGLNLLFIPVFGSMAAAVNTAIGYGVLALSMFTIARRRSPLPIQYKRIAKLGLNSSLIYIIGRMLMRFHPLINLLIGIAISLTLPISLALWGFWRSDEIQAIRNTSTRLFERFVRARR
jgi:O-antigen/teichoic acid export membrane protein